MNFLVVGGFLGSGKTSFILRLAHHMIDDLGINKIVILENEIGEIGIDDQVLRGSGYEVKGMFSGCVCCTMAGELPTNVRTIEQDLNPDWIIMEATGVAFPQAIKDNLINALRMTPRAVCLVDAQRWMRLLRPMEKLLPFQLKGADVVLINKADLVDEETRQAVKESVSQYSGDAELVLCSAKDGIDISVLERILGMEA